MDIEINKKPESILQTPGFQIEEKYYSKLEDNNIE